MGKEFKTKEDFEKHIEKITSVKTGNLVFPLKLKTFIQNEDYSKSACFIRFIPKFKKVVSDIANKVTKETLEPMSFSSIIMPILPVEDTLSNQWGSVEGAKLLAGEITGGKVIEYSSWLAARSLGAGVPEAVRTRVTKALTGGTTINPFDKLLYQGHQRRSINLTFNFLKPESKEDELNLRSIANLFRTLSIGSYDSLVIKNPILWNVEFVSYPDYSGFLKYKKCGIGDVTVRFGDDGEFKAMKSGMPFMSLSMSINETEYPSIEDVII